ncbi:MAG: hypothetical protein GY853_02160 [PVC group bacterium]|nr:hypothetical protein [PVC group bacterium]
MGLRNKFNILMAKQNQRTTARTNKRALKLKAKRIQLENKNKAIKSYNSEVSRITKAKNVKKTSKFGQRAASLRKKNAARFSNSPKDPRGSSSGSNPYWLKSNNSGVSMFGQSSTPYWLQGDKPKKKKSRGKTITIRL